MSILSYYARQIFDGDKRYEFRKSPIKESELNKPIFIYSAKDDKAIIGTVKVKKILCGTIDQIMKMTGYDKRKDAFEIVEYFKNSSKCYALELYDIQKFSQPLMLKKLRSIDPKLQLPQYFKYIYSKSPIYDELVNYKNK